MQKCLASYADLHKMTGMENISEILLELRKSRTQSEISRLTGISQSKLSRWEAGDIAAGADDALKLLALANVEKQQAKEAA